MRGPPSAQESQQLEELTLAVEDLRNRVAALERAAVPLVSGVVGGASGTVLSLEATPLPAFLQVWYRQWAGCCSGLPEPTCCAPWRKPAFCPNWQAPRSD